MATKNAPLTKSRVISAWQCPKKLYLEKHRPELGVVSAQTETLFATGHRVGEVAKALYGTADAKEIPFNRRRKPMTLETRRLIDAGAEFPIFEGTFEFESVLVRADVLLPDDGGWRLVEVKASTSVRDYHVLDCAIQAWVLRQSEVPLTTVSLAHIDNGFEYGGDDDYRGLLEEVDLTDEIRTVAPSVEPLILRAREALGGPLPKVPVGAHCSRPYDCQFKAYCWPHDTEYPIAGLGGSKAKLGSYVAMGCKDIRDVNADWITAETQARIHRVTTVGEPEILDGARETLRRLPYPRYFLDFETIAPAVPFWPGTRPYAAVPVQWSCHIDDGNADGRYAAMRHCEFLDLSGEPPMRRLAEELIQCLGDSGPVLMYTNYEERVIVELIARFPDLAPSLRAIVSRLFDLHPVVKANYYHPRMLGSWSIKAVLPTIAPHMDYARLTGIKEGSGASEGFIEAIDSETSADRKAELADQLLRYCRFDTEAMAELVRFFCIERG